MLNLRNIIVDWLRDNLSGYDIVCGVVFTESFSISVAYGADVCVHVFYFDNIFSISSFVADRVAMVPLNDPFFFDNFKKMIIDHVDLMASNGHY